MQLLRAAVLTVALAFGASAAQATDFSARVEASALLDEMNMRSQFDQLVNVMLDNQVSQNPSLAPFKAVMAEFFRKYMSYDALKPDLIAVYENNYTVAELHDLRMFYATPTGKKMLRLTPEIARQSAELGTKRVQEHVAELQQMIKDEAERIQKAQAASPAQH
jgi:hypothetical protein